ncbi:MAG: inner membrane CreD family protein [Pseudomonadota bacterium]|nr:inner membrane CreD family protein [Pseudomonadota bacterium]
MLRTLGQFAAVGIIFVGFSIAWMILGTVNADRTEGQASRLLKRVQNSYGGPLVITPPRIYYEKTNNRKVEVAGLETITTYRERETVDPSASNVVVDLSLERKKVGNLWFPVFLAKYQGHYEYDIEAIPEDVRVETLFVLPGLSSSESIFRDIEFKINDALVEPLARLVSNTPIELTAAQYIDGKLAIDFDYESTGTEYMLYLLSDQGTSRSRGREEKQLDNLEKERLTRLDNFSFRLTTDFIKYELPKRTGPYSSFRQRDGQSEFEWRFNTTVTGKDIGLIVPRELIPGDIASRISFFAPISLLFFFVVLTIFGILAKNPLHPMHFAFLAATFLSFHLTFSYSADHISMYPAFVIASLVACLLTFNYMVRVKDKKYALVVTSLQLLYLVVFSWSFFYQTDSGLGITGLIVTIVSVATLFVLMQLTAKLNWQNLDLANQDKKLGF